MCIHIHIYIYMYRMSFIFGVRDPTFVLDDPAGQAPGCVLPVGRACRWKVQAGLGPFTADRGAPSLVGMAMVVDLGVRFAGSLAGKASLVCRAVSRQLAPEYQKPEAAAGPQSPEARTRASHAAPCRNHLPAVSRKVSVCAHRGVRAALS